MERKQPGKIRFDSAKNDANVVPTLRDYQRNFIGVIKSYIDRMPFSVQLYNQVIGEWNKTKRYLRRRKPQNSGAQKKITKKPVQKIKFRRAKKPVHKK